MILGNYLRDLREVKRKKNRERECLTTKGGIIKCVQLMASEACNTDSEEPVVNKMLSSVMPVFINVVCF